MGRNNVGKGHPTLLLRCCLFGSGEDVFTLAAAEKEVSYFRLS